MANNIIVIVDGYSTGQYLAPQLTIQGFSCVHIQSTAIIPEVYQPTFHYKNFIKNYIYNGDLNDLLVELEILNPICVMAGSEIGVELADAIGEGLGVSHNSTKLSLARRNKYHMIEALKNAGLATVQHFQSKDAKEIMQWRNENKISPIVLKPVKSGGSDHVYFCTTDSEIKHACIQILETKNFYDLSNECVLAQSFLHGTEYVVNTISCEGEHYVAEIWQCHKERVEGAGYISVMEELLPFDFSPNNILLANYAKRVLDALKIKYGPGHLEIMLTNKGPVLIEIGARLQGCVDPDIVADAMNGHSTVSLMIDSYLFPQKFKSHIRQPYPVEKSLFRIFIKSNRDGILAETPDMSDIKKLSSFGSLMKFKSVAGDSIKKTCDLGSCYGVIHLVHFNSEQLKVDYENYKRYEENKLFKMVDSTLENEVVASDDEARPKFSLGR